jgi:hypothetical protein
MPKYISPTIVNIPHADGIQEYVRGTVNFGGTATFSVDGTGATYEWSLGNVVRHCNRANPSGTYKRPVFIL